MPRDRENSRVKDLPDLALLAKVRELDAGRLRQALEQTFEFRRTHALPISLPPPPQSWTEVYRRMAGEDELDWGTLADLVVAVRAFLDPVLVEEAPFGRWHPEKWAWDRSRTPNRRPPRASR